MKSKICSLLFVLMLALVSCEEDTTLKLTVVTSPVDQVTFTTALVGGNVTSGGSSDVTDRGVYWGTTADPKTVGRKLSIGTGAGIFSQVIDVLAVKTKYYVQAFATNGQGTNYGEVVSFTTGGNDGTYTDPRDGKVYSIKTIGTQTWMVRSMDYLPSVSPSTLESGTEKLYYVYDYEGTDVAVARASANYTTYGVLYNWQAALSACPGGWHLPTDAEWKLLETSLGMSQADADIEGSRSSGSVGNQIKANTGWGTGANGTNSSGLTILPAGFTYPGGGFGSLGNMAQLWSATEKDGAQAWTRILYGAGYGVERRSLYKSRGYSVRCLKDK